MEFTKQEMVGADLVVLVDPEGLVKWSSHRDRDDVVDMLRGIADSIADGSL